MSKRRTIFPGELESMDGDDERSDRSASPRTIGQETVLPPHSERRTRASVNLAQRTRRRVTMAVDSVSVQRITHSGRQHGQQVLRNMQDANDQDRNVNDKSRKRRRPRRKNRKWKPYTQLSWEERQQRDEEESRRASLKRANRPTPYNTTQFLMEDHKVDTPDLSNMGTFDENHDVNLSSSDEVLENENEQYLVRNFTAVYDEVQSERLQQMSKEQLVNEVLELSKKVSELEQILRPSSGGGGEGKLSSGESEEQLDEATRSRLQSVNELEQKVKKLKEENQRLRTASGTDKE
ncbi:protein HEXIM1-like [Lytechinus pictus]|uniref:protein HEXIM1-like n=1 Tax=Lytechinus pictus TaxID=7653 RepID=UPI0030B9F4B6